MSGDMEVQVREHGAIVVLELWGKLTAGENAELLRTRFQERLEAGNRFFVLDCSTKFKYMDSAGVDAILECNEAVVQHGGVVKLVEKPSCIDAIPRHWKILSIYWTVDSALASFEHD